MAGPAVLKIDIIADASKAIAGMSRAGGQVEKTGSRIKSGLKGFAVGIGAVFAADKIKDFAMESITAASDLAETMSKTQQIFGSSADAITAWSKDSSNSLGLSQKDALDAADTFAIFGKSAGLSGSALTDFSTDLTGTAADFASFANTTPDEAIDAIGAALRGETEPIRKYGLMLNDASIKNEAMRLGLIKTTKVPIDPKKRSVAVKSLIDNFAKGQKITGDFARTSGGLANQQRIMAAKMENLKASIGTQLLPVMLTAIKLFQKMGTFVKDNSAWLVPLAAGIAVVAAAIKVATIVQRLFNVTLMTSPIFWIIAAVVALAVALVVLYKRSATFRAIIAAAFAAVKVAGEALWTGLKAAFAGIMVAVRVVYSVIKAVFGAIVAAVKFYGRILYYAYVWPWVTAYNIITAAVRAIINWVPGAFRSVVSGIKTALSTLGAVITAPFRAAWTWIKNSLVPAVKGSFNAVAGAIRRAVSTIAGIIRAPFSAAWTWIRNTLVPAVKGGFNTVAAAIRRSVSTVTSAITAPFSAAWKWIQVHVGSPIRNMFNGLAKAIGKAMSDVEDAIIGPFESAWDWIKKYILGPIKSAWNGVADAINGIHFSAKIPSWVPGVGGKGFTFDPPNVPTLAQGGYVDQATLAIIGEGSRPRDRRARAMLRRIIREDSPPARQHHRQRRAGPGRRRQATQSDPAGRHRHRGCGADRPPCT